MGDVRAWASGLFRRLEPRHLAQACLIREEECVSRSLRNISKDKEMSWTPYSRSCDRNSRFTRAFSNVSSFVEEREDTALRKREYSVEGSGRLLTDWGSRVASVGRNSGFCRSLGESMI